MTTTTAVRHGTVTGYTTDACRCEPCRAAIRTYSATRLAKRRTERVLLGGRLYAPNAPVHGTPSTYTGWACRCLPCTRAYRHAGQERRATQPATQPTFRNGVTDGA